VGKPEEKIPVKGRGPKQEDNIKIDLRKMRYCGKGWIRQILDSYGPVEYFCADGNEHSAFTKY
jgi:hypothetical protein